MILSDYEYFRTELGVLYKGDCLEILPLIEDKIDLVLTDPPYGIKMDSKLNKNRGNMDINSILLQDGITKDP